ncbi:MAG: hypothetical protein EOS41_25405 [Mesorhizobium sp.]|nr:MAG: hypothetical protein EOS41_25405 [Mesorhizobium sp.]
MKERGVDLIAISSARVEVRPELAERLAGQHPPLSCRTSPPQGGRLAVTSAFANLQRSQFRSKAERARHSPSIASAIRAMACW